MYVILYWPDHLCLRQFVIVFILIGFVDTTTTGSGSDRPPPQPRLCYDTQAPLLDPQTNSTIACQSCLPSQIANCPLCPGDHSYCSNGVCCPRGESVQTRDESDQTPNLGRKTTDDL